MKKVFFIGSIIFLGLLICAPQTTFAQRKAASPEAKAKLKKFKKEGWKVDSDRSDEVVLTRYYEKRDANPNLKVVTGQSSKCKSTNICRQVALTNAQNELAQRLSSKIEGAISTLVRHDATHPQEDIEKTTKGLITKIKADVSGLLEPAFSISREKGGMIEYKMYFLYDPKKVSDNMEKVLEQSLKETKLTIEEAKSISKFVNDELNNEADMD